MRLLLKIGQNIILFRWDFKSTVLKAAEKPFLLNLHYQKHDIENSGIHF